MKRGYKPLVRSDGARVLVGRIWPLGLSKEAAGLDAWLADIAPSAELRAWFAPDPKKWASSKRRYFLERAIRRQRRAFIITLSR